MLAESASGSALTKLTVVKVDAAVKLRVFLTQVWVVPPAVVLAVQIRPSGDGRVLRIRHVLAGRPDAAAQP